MDEIEKQIRRMENIRKRNEQIKEENEKKLSLVLEQIDNIKYRQYWERLNKGEVRNYWIWTFKLKKDVDKSGYMQAPVFRGIWIGYNRDTHEVTLLFGWEKSYAEAKMQRKIWMPEGEVKTLKVEDLEIVDRQRMTIIKLGR